MQIHGFCQTAVIISTQGLGDEPRVAAFMSRRLITI